MRDKNRIKPFLEELGKLWSRVPDWRFGQLIYNLTRGKSLFNIEEDELLDIIKDLIEKGLVEE